MVELSTEDLLERILCADVNELNEIIDAVEERFQELWPDWDLLMITCNGHTPEDHINILQQSIHILSNAANKDLL